MEAWFFDIYPVENGMVLWFIDAQGRHFRTVFPYAPSFYIHGSRGRLKEVTRLLSKLTSRQKRNSKRSDVPSSPLRPPIEIVWDSRKEFYSDRYLTVLRVTVNSPLFLGKVVRRVASLPDIELFNCDIPVEQLFCYEHRIFPTAFCEIAHSPEFRVHVLDSPWDTDYILPPLRRMILAFEADGINPSHGKRSRLVVVICGVTHVIEGASESEALATLASIIRREDPDLILTHWGDSFLIPALEKLSEKHRIPIPFNRDPEVETSVRNPRSYFSYGRIVHSAGARIFRGRWHLDIENSFIMRESGIEGLIELARLAKIPVQTLARMSTGTGISSMQLDRAFQDGYLIPWRKRVPEAFKSAYQLLSTDKGGLTYLPPVGFFEDVAEIDFASMYPVLMERFNISPETVNCRCCTGKGASIQVPEIDHTICTRRRGLVPRVLAPLIEKRERYKQLRNSAAIEEQKHLSCLARSGVLAPVIGGETPRPLNDRGTKGKGNLCAFELATEDVEDGPPQSTSRESKTTDSCVYDRRQNAIKWILVTCFGYLGYRNARFGRIEAHEAVTAYSREILLKAKEIAEKQGFTMLHAIVDSLWVKREGATDEDYRNLAETIASETGLPVSLEGIYNWIGFLPSRTNPRVGVHNRFYGVFRTGKVKVRGLEMRRHDTPPIVASMQQEMLSVLSRAKNLEELRRAIPGALEVLDVYLVRLRDGEVRFPDLAIRRRISVEPTCYRQDNLTAIAARMLMSRGVNLSAGEKIDYVILDHASPVKDLRVVPLALAREEASYDVGKYAEMLRKAAEALLGPFGCEFIRRWCTAAVQNTGSRVLSDRMSFRVDIEKGEHELHE